jgi:hypothetical protein
MRVAVYLKIGVGIILPEDFLEPCVDHASTSRGIGRDPKENPMDTRVRRTSGGHPTSTFERIRRPIREIEE